MSVDIGNRVSHGVGGSYTKYQGKPPAHSVYKVETSMGSFYLKLYYRHGEVRYEQDYGFAHTVELDQLSDEDRAELDRKAKDVAETDDFISAD